MSKKSTNKISQYIDPTGEYSNRKLKFGSWYLKHKILIKKIFLSTLLTWSIFSITFSIYGWGRYIIFDYKEINIILEEMLKPTPEIEANHTARTPINLKIEKIDVFENGAENKYDFFAKMKNPNIKTIAFINYKFIYSGGETEETQTFLLPNQEKPIAVLGQTIDYFPTNTKLDITKIEWQNINPHTVADPINYIENRQKFDLENFNFIKADKKQEIFTHTIEFDITNNSIFDFWEGIFYITYLNNIQEVGVNKIVLEQFKAGETRKIELKSLIDDIQITGVELSTEINPFDNNTYMPVGL